MRQNNQSDAVVLVQLRNQFYKNKYHALLGLFFLSLIVIVFLIWVLLYLIKHPPHPLYFVTDNATHFIQDVPRNQPNMSDDDAGKWVSEAIVSAFSYDFVNYRLQLQDANKYFTEFGWRTYMDSLRANNNLLALTERKMVAIAKVVDKPKLLNKGILGGAFAWKFELPVLVTYLTPPYDDKSQFSNPLLITVVMQRQSLLTSYKGIGIVQMIANLVYTQPQQNVALPTG